MERTEPPGRISLPIHSKEQQLLHRRISGDGMLTDKQGPYERYVVKRCEDICRAVRSSPELDVALQYHIMPRKRDLRSFTRWTYDIKFTPTFRTGCVVQQTLLSVVIDDALEQLATAYRMHYTRTTQSSSTNTPSIHADIPNLEELLRPSSELSMIKSNHAHSPGNDERRKNTRDDVGTAFARP